MKRFLTALFVLVFLAGCGGQPTGTQIDAVVMSNEMGSGKGAASSRQVQLAIDNAVNSELAVVFVHLDWATLFRHRQRYVEFATQFPQELDSKVLFHYVDCTPVTDGYAPLREIDGWNDLRSTSRNGHLQSLIHGKGEVVWLCKGRVLEVRPVWEFENAGQLIRHTNRIYAHR